MRGPGVVTAYTKVSVETGWICPKACHHYQISVPTPVSSARVVCSGTMVYGESADLINDGDCVDASLRRLSPLLVENTRGLCYVAVQSELFQTPREFVWKALQDLAGEI